MNTLRGLTLVALCAACTDVNPSVLGSTLDDEIGDSGSSDTTETDTDSETTETVTHVCGNTFDLLECESNYCLARWAGTSAWSSVMLPGIVDQWPPVDPASVFPCAPFPLVDGCGALDDNGHVGCWVLEGECARMAEPLCAIVDVTPTDVWPDWMPCGAGEPIGMPALCSDTLCWSATGPSSSILPGCL